MATGIIGPTLGAAQLAATLSGVPFAAGGVMVLQMINVACSEVTVHKQKSKQLVQRCTELLILISEQSTHLAGTDASVPFDEAEAVLRSVHSRIEKWTHYGKIKRFFKSSQIARDLDKCSADVDNALERLHVSHPVTLLRMQQRSIDMVQQLQQHQAAFEDKFQQLLISPQDIQRAVEQHISGSNAAYELMRLGQERLVGLRGEGPFMTMLSDGRQIDESPAPSRPPSPITTVQHQIEKALSDLHRLTNIPPTIPILNNQVKMINGRATRGGPFSEIFEGRWLGEKKVALKTIRIMNADDPKSQRLKLRFEHEITVWSQLKHENVLTMLGVITNTDLVHIVSPWQLNDLLNYRRGNPEVNPLKLLSQAAKGLEYLHSQDIVHGHLKCSNMLISEEGVVSLSDFGLTQVLTEVVGREAIVTLSTTSAVRWHAPELNNGDEDAPTKTSDVFSFGMSILELLTLKPPYSHRKRDIFVVQDLGVGKLPPRPQEPAAQPWMTDELWDMLNRCWKWNPQERMLAEELSPCLEQVSESLGKL